MLTLLSGRDNKFLFSFLIYLNNLNNSSLFLCARAEFRNQRAAVDILLLCASAQEGRASEPTIVPLKRGESRVSMAFVVNC